MSAAAISDRHTYIPSGQGEIVDFVGFLRASGRTVAAPGPRLISSDGSHEMAVPDEIFDVLVQVAEQLSAGRGVSVVPTDTQMTTQEAAEFLGISRPTLVKLLEGGALAYTKVGRHRRVMLQDLISYEDQQRSQRRQALGQLSRQSAEDGSVFLVPGSSETR
ncbi:helix-turn-helix domain-containing protein [Arthrobacter rhombi]|uniref:helix-turn-helix domain-containing protein n=1 Tax=Arthrobacter rhombi TaxID=71253 RepID=UPI003FD47E77